MNFTFTTAVAGSAVINPVNMGTAYNTGGTSELAVYVEHDSGGDLYNCGFYIQPFSGTNYVGLYGESADYLNVLDWGTNTTEGFVVNMDAAATDGSFDVQFYADATSATGASGTNAIIFATEMFQSGNSTGVGHFPASDTGHSTFKLSVPATETSVGLRMFSIFMRFEQ